LFSFAAAWRNKDVYYKGAHQRNGWWLVTQKSYSVSTQSVLSVVKRKDFKWRI